MQVFWVLFRRLYFIIADLTYHNCLSVKTTNNSYLAMHIHTVFQTDCSCYMSVSEFKLPKRPRPLELLMTNSWLLLQLKLVKPPLGLALWTKVWFRSRLPLVVISTALAERASKSTWQPLSSWNTSLLHIMHKNMRGWMRRDSVCMRTRAMRDMGTKPRSLCGGCCCCSGCLLMFWFSENTMAVGGKVAMGTRINFCSSGCPTEPFSAARSCSRVICCFTLSWRSTGSYNKIIIIMVNMPPVKVN